MLSKETIINNPVIPRFHFMNYRLLMSKSIKECWKTKNSTFCPEPKFSLSVTKRVGKVYIYIYILWVARSLIENTNWFLTLSTQSNLTVIRFCLTWLTNFVAGFARDLIRKVFHYSKTIQGPVMLQSLTLIPLKDNQLMDLRICL